MAICIDTLRRVWNFAIYCHNLEDKTIM